MNKTLPVFTCLPRSCFSSQSSFLREESTLAIAPHISLIHKSGSLGFCFHDSMETAHTGVSNDTGVPYPWSTFLPLFFCLSLALPTTEHIPSSLLSLGFYELSGLLPPPLTSPPQFLSSLLPVLRLVSLKFYPWPISIPTAYMLSKYISTLIYLDGEKLSIGISSLNLSSEL